MNEIRTKELCKISLKFSGERLEFRGKKIKNIDRIWQEQN